jgi:hypothetical protein
MALNFYHAAVSTTTPVSNAVGIVDGNAARIGTHDTLFHQAGDTSLQFGLHRFSFLS